MRIAAVFNVGSANSHYRAVQPLRELARRGHDVCWPGHPSFAVAQTRTPDWDLLYVSQSVNPSVAALAQRLRASGVAVVWDTDDDISQVPRYSQTYRRLGGKRKIKRLFERTVAMARGAHLMTTTCEHLAGVYRATGVEHVVAIENHLAPEDVARPRHRHAGVVIGCTAAVEHRGDYARLRIAEALEAVLRAHDGVRVVTLGERLPIRDPRYAHRAAVPIDRLLDAEADFDVGLAPLLDTPLNRARSNVKLKEYAAVGATWLASPVGPYAGMGEAQGGQLVSEGGWLAALEELIADYRRRAALQQRARTWVKGQSARHAGDRWEAAFRAAILRARAEAGTRAPAVRRARAS